MDWTTFIFREGGWGASATLVAAFFRLLLKGELVLKREFDAVVTQSAHYMEEAKARSIEGAVASKETISIQRELINHLKSKEGPDA